MESCESLVEDADPLIAAQEIQTVFRDFLPPNVLPDGLVEACITCLQQYVQSKVQGSNQLARSGVFWVNMGLLQIKLWTPQTIFDPAVKRAYKLNYAQQEVSKISRYDVACIIIDASLYLLHGSQSVPRLTTRASIRHLETNHATYIIFYNY